MHDILNSKRSVIRCELFLLLSFLACLSQQAFGQFRYTQWTADSGLPQSSVRGLTQTPDGFLWVATLNGVARFDGIHFQVFDKSNTPGITSNRFVGMVSGEGNDLWLTSEDGGLICFHNGTFRTIAEAAGIQQHTVLGITRDDAAHIWVQSNGAVLRWNSLTEHFERESFSTKNLSFRSLWWIGTGFWAQRDKQIICFNRGHLRTFAIPSSIPSGQIRAIAANAYGDVWLGTKDGRIGKLGGKAVTLTARSDTFALHAVGLADWTIKVSARRFQRSLQVPVDGVIKEIPMNVIGFDNEGNTWVGSEGEGLFRIQKQFITALTSNQGLASNNVYPVLRSKNGDIWAGSWPGGLSQIRDGHVLRTFRSTQGVPGLVTSLMEDRDGNLWIGTHGGVRKLVNGRIMPPPMIYHGIRAVPQVIDQTADGAMLFGTPEGLDIIRGSSLRHLTAADGLAADDVRVILENGDDLWIGGYGGLTRLHQGQLTRWTEKEGLPSNNIRCIVKDSSGALWVGTYDGGIGWFHNGRWFPFNKDNGLFDNGAFQILEDERGWFWISSNRGIFRVSLAQLRAVAEKREKLVTSISYGRTDGMPSAECNGGLWPAGAKGPNGTLWFPTQMGLAVLDPHKIRLVNEPPKVALKNIYINHEPQPASGSVTLRPGQTDLQIDYTALSFTNPEQITFRYRLKGLDKDWQQVGLRRTAYYTHLPPGDYTFEAAAETNAGIRSTHNAWIRVIIAPPFYRRWWFIALMLLLTFCTVSSLWSIRVKQLQQVQLRQQSFSRDLIASQEGERRRIAAELHDSLGQRLIVINNLALLLLRAKGKVRSEEEKRKTIEEISGEASAAIEETRVISYALRPFQLDRLGLTRAIQALCTTVTRASDVIVRTDLEDIDDVLPEDLRINVYRIVQEGLNNIVKHSGATQAIVSSSREQEIVTLNIRDNGRGIVTQSRVALTGQGGFGITGMRERITSLNGSLRVESSAAAGTLLTIQFPIAHSGSNERCH